MSNRTNFFRKKPIPKNNQKELGLKRCLSAFDLITYGIGFTIGAGIFILTGIVAATTAGPGVILSYGIAGLACLFSALAYAELSSSIGGCGSAYTYAYAGFGECIAWLVGWILLLEYGMGASVIAIGWSGYFSHFLQSLLDIHLPAFLLHGPMQGGLINLPAVLIVAVLAFILCAGTTQSFRLNTIMVVIKLLIIAIFIGVGLFHINIGYWQPFTPFGFEGIAQGAALVFFAYFGFDGIATTAEETKNPQRDLPIGIIGALVSCTLLYIVVAAILTGIAPFQSLNTESPVSEVLATLGHENVALIIGLGAVAGLTTVLIGNLYAVTRVFLAISRDGLLPKVFSTLHSKRKTPNYIIMLCTIIVGCIAGFLPIDEAAKLVNIGGLTAFAMVCAGVIFLRASHPDLPRPFKLPFNPLIPVLGIISCFYLIMNLPIATWIRFAVWVAIGVGIYLIYGYKASIACSNEGVR